jgi:hypothetical protein
MLGVGAGALGGTGCGDEPTNTPTSIVGSWVATNLTAPGEPQWGDAVADDGLSVTMTFTAGGSYTFDIGDDDPADPWMCPGTASCSYSGSYQTAGSTLTLDAGTADESSATYTFSGNRLTIAFQATAASPTPYTFVLRQP